jgi:hypothetical protein
MASYFYSGSTDGLSTLADSLGLNQLASTVGWSSPGGTTVRALGAGNGWQ